MISLPELERVQLAERADLEMLGTGQRRVKSARGSQELAMIEDQINRGKVGGNWGSNVRCV